MTITEMRVTPVAISDPPLLNAAGLHAPYALRTIVELISDDRISGVGEVPGGERTTRALEAAADVVVGCDPYQLNGLRQALESRFAPESAQERGESPWDRRVHNRVFSAVEVACHDLIGKAVGRPVCDLLGGRVRGRVDFSAYLFYKHEGAGGELGFRTDPGAAGWPSARHRAALDPDGIVSQARAMCEEYGFRSIKLKGGAFPPDEEADAILALRDAFGPKVPLRIDPNAIWTVETAVRIGRRLSGVLEYFEDPVRGQEQMAEVSKSLDMPLATNMCTTSFDDIPQSVRLGSEQIILSDHHFWGGLRASLELARICRTFGRGLSMHSNSHLGISLAAMAHLAAATPNLTYACDTHYPWQCEEVIAGGRRSFDDGAFVVTDEPGLGVKLDHEALSRLHERYLECGLTERDDGAEMRKLHPEWLFEPVRW